VIITIAMVQVPFLVLGHNTFPDQLTFRKYCTLEPPLKDQALSLSLSLCYRELHSWEKQILVLCSTGILGFRILYTRFGDQQDEEEA